MIDMTEQFKYLVKNTDPKDPKYRMIQIQLQKEEERVLKAKIKRKKEHQEKQDAKSVETVQQDIVIQVNPILNDNEQIFDAILPQCESGECLIDEVKVETPKKTRKKKDKQ